MNEKFCLGGKNSEIENFVGTAIVIWLYKMCKLHFSRPVRFEEREKREQWTINAQSQRDWDEIVIFKQQTQKIKPSLKCNILLFSNSMSFEMKNLHSRHQMKL